MIWVSRRLSKRRAGSGSGIRRVRRMRMCLGGLHWPSAGLLRWVGRAVIGDFGSGVTDIEATIWQAKWWTNTVPNHDSLGEWTEGGPCFLFFSFCRRCCFCFTVSACKGLQSTSDVPALLDIPTGSLGNGAKGVYGRAYFWNMELRVGVFLFLFLLSYLHR